MRRHRKDRPGDVIRSLVFWMPIMSALVIVGLIADLVFSVRAGVSFAVIPGLVSAVFYNVVALGVWWFLKDRMLANAEKWDQEEPS